MLCLVRPVPEGLEVLVWVECERGAGRDCPGPHLLKGSAKILGREPTDARQSLHSQISGSYC